MSNAPVVLFVYNRLFHAKSAIDSLLSNREAASTDLIIYSDGPKQAEDRKIPELREYLKTVTGFKSVTLINRERNFGLANNIITGLTEQFEKYERLIVLEDDLVISPFFLRYMNDGLDLYNDEERAGSIHGYIYPVKIKLPNTFFIRGGDCWGWATWKRAWKHFEPDGKKLLQQIDERKLKNEFDYHGAYSYYGMLKKQTEGKNSSWAVRWHASLFLKGMLTLYPGVSFVRNQGADESGTHVKKTTAFDTDVCTEYKGIEKIETLESAAGKKAIGDFFFSIHKNPLKRFLKY